MIFFLLTCIDKLSVFFEAKFLSCWFIQKPKKKYGLIVGDVFRKILKVER